MLIRCIYQQALLATGKKILSRVNKSTLTNLGMEGRGAPLEDVVGELNRFADPGLAEGWDNVGLLLEPTRPHSVTRVLLTNDLTPPVLEEAVASRADLVVSYHPPLFAPLKRITQSTWKERLVVTCLEKRIAVYSPHTAWDAVYGGVGDSLASAFSDFIESVAPIVPNSGPMTMFDVMTSQKNKPLLKDHIISSVECNGGDMEVYRVRGNSELMEQMAALPFTVVTKLQQIPNKGESKVGMGRVVRLKEPGVRLDRCVELIKTYTGLPHLRLATAPHHNPESLVRTVAVVPGSGGSLLKGARADLFVTGEMLHHDILDSAHNGTSVILTNHSDSERPFLATFQRSLAAAFPSIDIRLSARDADPLQTV